MIRWRKHTNVVQTNPTTSAVSSGPYSLCRRMRKKGSVPWRMMSSFLTCVHTQGQNLSAFLGKHLCISRLTVCKDLGPYSSLFRPSLTEPPRLALPGKDCKFGESQSLFCLHEVNSVCTVQGLATELSFFFLLHIFCCISHMVLLLNLKVQLDYLDLQEFLAKKADLVRKGRRGTTVPVGVQV